MPYSTENKSIADIYYEELMKDTSSPGSVLMKLFCELYGHERNRTDLVMFNDLVKVYGKERVFKIVLEAGGKVRKDKKNPNYLRAVVKRRLSDSFKNEKDFERQSITEELDEFVNSRNEKIKELSKIELIIPRLFEDE